MSREAALIFGLLLYVAALAVIVRAISERTHAHPEEAAGGEDDQGEAGCLHRGEE